jgi:hypothetical protein
MNNSPVNPPNPIKNITFFIKDISNNDPFTDPSGKTIINPVFDPLQYWGKNKLNLMLEDNNNNHIKNMDNSFIMRLNTIIDNIRKEGLKNAHLSNIKTSLNNDQKNKPLKQIVFNDALNTKDALADLLFQITNKYNFDDNTVSKTDIIYHTNPAPLFSKRQSPLFAPSTAILPPVLEIKRELKIIDQEVNGIKDLLKLIEDNPITPYIEYNINMQAMHNIKEPLNELNEMIGMSNLKNSVVDQIIYFVQNLHINKDAVNPDFMHTCIYGPPGTGKTETAKIMGKIFSSLGILKKNYFKKVTRADLVAGYLGQTAIKTRDVIKNALGGVLFIDEAYALGNQEKRDSFAKECIDTICEGLSDHKGELMVIIAGYEDDLKKCFFSYNQGLNSRFPWRFKTDNYKGSELNQIFQKKVIDAGWTLIEKIPDLWFDSKMDMFTFYGRDMETLLSKTKIAHGRRVFCKPQEEKMKLTMKDVEKGYDMFIDNNEVKGRDTKRNKIDHMYI